MLKKSSVSGFRVARRLLNAAINIALIAAFPLTFPTQSHGQAQTPAEAPTVIRATTNLVQLDVIVTDKDTPVHRLDKQRFHLTEDGNDQPIQSVDEHQLETSPRPAASDPLPPNTWSNQAVYPATGAVNVLLLDGLNTPFVDQARVRIQMIELLSKIQPGTQLALFTLSSRLRLVQGFTTDPAALVKTLKKNSTNPSHPISLDSSVSLEGENAAIASMRQFEADISPLQTDIRVQTTLLAMQQIARYLNSIPGRKNLLWLSGAFPITLNPDPNLPNPFASMRNYAADLSDTGALLSAARVAVYPIDARGLMGLPSFSASQSPSRYGSQQFSQKDANFFSQTQAEHAAMDQLASDTGGKALYNTNDLQAAVTQSINSGANYYTLSFVPPANHLDGEFHKLRLRIDGAKYHLTYRPGYYADNPAKPSLRLAGSSIMRQAALYGAPPATQLRFEAQIEPVAKDPGSAPAGESAPSLKQPTTRHAIQVYLHPDTLALQAAPDGTRHGQVEFAAIAYDQDGNRLNYTAYNLPVNLTTDQYAHIAEERLPIRARIDLPPGPSYLRIVLRDLLNQKVGSLEIPVTAPAK